LRFGWLGGVALVLAAACGSDEDGAAPNPVVPKDARADVPAEARDTGADRADTSIDANDAGADTADAGADTNDTGADGGTDAGDASEDGGGDASETGSDASDGGAEADAALPLVLCPIVAGAVPVGGARSAITRPVSTSTTWMPEMAACETELLTSDRSRSSNVAPTATGPGGGFGFALRVVVGLRRVDFFFFFDCPSANGAKSASSKARTAMERAGRMVIERQDSNSGATVLPR
jgi:hypothetical protein